MKDSYFYFNIRIYIRIFGDLWYNKHAQLHAGWAVATPLKKGGAADDDRCRCADVNDYVCIADRSRHRCIQRQKVTHPARPK